MYFRFSNISTMFQFNVKYITILIMIDRGVVVFQRFCQVVTVQLTSPNLAPPYKQIIWEVSILTELWPVCIFMGWGFLTPTASNYGPWTTECWTTVCRFGPDNIDLGLVWMIHKKFLSTSNKIPTRGAEREKGSNVYLLLIVAMVLLLWCQIILLWHQVTIVASEQHL